MNWRKAAEEDLRRYSAQKESLDNLRERMGALELKIKSVRGSFSDTAPTHGGGNHYEDALLDNIVERERLRYSYRAAKHLVGLTERGLARLDTRERRVLEAFYIQRESGHVEKLMSEMHFERSRVYQVKDAALYKFTVCMYGLIDY